MTQIEQQIKVRAIDAKAHECIPESAKQHFRHKPFGKWEDKTNCQECVGAGAGDCDMCRALGRDWKGREDGE